MKKNTKVQSSSKSGQALVVLLVFVVISLTIVSAAVTVVLVNSQSATSVEQGELARAAADSGLEEALLRLVRDPTFTGETLTLGDGSVTVVVSGTNPKTVTAQGRWGNFGRSEQAIVNLTSGQLTVVSWQEVY